MTNKKQKKEKEKNSSNSNNRVIIDEYFTEKALVSVYVFVSRKEHKLEVHFGPCHVFKYSLNLS